LVDLDEISYFVDAIVGDVNVKTIDPIVSITLKLFTFKFLRWMHYLHYSASPDNGLELFSIVGYPWLYHIQTLDDVSMGIKACTLPKVEILSYIKN
jgi:hypothetical protein